MNCLLTLQTINEMKAHQHIAVVEPRSQLTAIKSPVFRTVEIHVKVFAHRFTVFIEFSGSKINGAYTRDDSAFSDTLRTEMIGDLKHHSRLDSLFELREILDRRNLRLFRFRINRWLRLHRCRLRFFRFSLADIFIKTAVKELIIGDILRDSKAAAVTLNCAIVRIERQRTCQRNNLRNLASNFVTKSVSNLDGMGRLFLSGLLCFERRPLCFLFGRKVCIVPEP